MVCKEAGRHDRAKGLTSSEEVVGALHKSDLHDRVSMGKEAAVAVPKVQAPDLDVLVSGAADQESAVRGDVHAQHRQLVAVQGQEELEAICEEDLDGGI